MYSRDFAQMWKGLRGRLQWRRLGFTKNYAMECKVKSIVNKSVQTFGTSLLLYFPAPLQFLSVYIVGCDSALDSHFPSFTAAHIYNIISAVWIEGENNLFIVADWRADNWVDTVLCACICVCSSWFCDDDDDTAAADAGCCLDQGAVVVGRSNWEHLVRDTGSNRVLIKLFLIEIKLYQLYNQAHI